MVTPQKKTMSDEDRETSSHRWPQQRGPLQQQHIQDGLQQQRNDLQQQNASTFSTTTVKLPTFWTSSVRFWFIQADAQFSTHGIVTDEMKYSHVITSLPEDVAVRVMDILSNPPLQDKYSTLKKRLIEEYTLSSAEMAAALLDFPGIGDMKPSQLLQKLLSYIPVGEKPGFLVREIFLRQLPSDVRDHIADKSSLSLENLAREADKYFTSYGTRLVNKIEVLNQPQHISQNKDKKKKSGFCFYHSKFGDKAHKCISPCSYHPEN